MNDTHVCGPFYSIPNEVHECRESIWSVGTSCRRCPVEDCYRRGWLKAQVLRDNAKLATKHD